MALAQTAFVMKKYHIHTKAEDILHLFPVLIKRLGAVATVLFWRRAAHRSVTRGPVQCSAWLGNFVFTASGAGTNSTRDGTNRGTHSKLRKGTSETAAELEQMPPSEIVEKRASDDAVCHTHWRMPEKRRRGNKTVKRPKNDKPDGNNERC